MAHPAKLLAELNKKVPGEEVRHWVYGFFSTTFDPPANGLKGVLAAGGDRLLFYSKDESLYVVPFEDIRSVQAELDGNAHLSCQTDRGSIDVSYISRGDAAELISHLRTHCRNL